MMMSNYSLSDADLAESTSFRWLRGRTARRSKPLEQAQELTTALLLAFLERELSGRRADRITGAPSHRKFFLGTIAPRKEDEESDEGEEVASIEETHDFSTVGTRFMLRNEDIAHARLEINLGFSIFYPVFPTWEEVVGAIRIDTPPGGEDDDTEESNVTDRGRKIGSREYNLPTVEKRLSVADKWTVTLRDVASAPAKEVRLPFTALRDRADAARADPDALRIRHGDDRLFKRLEAVTPEDLQGENPAGRYANRIDQLRNSGELVLPTYDGEVTVSLVPYDDTRTEVSVVFGNLSRPGNFAPITKANFFDTRFKVRVADAAIEPVVMDEAERRGIRRTTAIAAKGVRCAVVEEQGVVENLPIPFEIVAARETDETFVALCGFDALMTPNAADSLGAIARTMKQYSLTWRAQNMAESDDRRRAYSESLREKFEGEIQRFEAGISALRMDRRALTAFHLANHAIRAAKGYQGWRPFQLVFFVSILKDIVARERPDVGDDRDKADVLWFPTGGGKTETYLALILFTLVYDRLRGKHRGVSAWVKFPLRMLSLDQLDRFAEMIMVLNNACDGHEPTIPGDSFDIGYFMGDRNTPNQWSLPAQYARYGLAPHDLAGRFDQARRNHPGITEREIAGEATKGLSDVDSRRYMLIDVCPLSKCSEATYLWPDSTARTMTIKCPTHGRIPIRFIDDELYRYPTSIIISTIDKLAIIAFNDGIRNLVVRPYFKCRDHGFLPTRTCRHCDEIGAKNRAIEPVDASQFYDPAPALQVQDELHLLKEQLGAYDSHYEALIAYLHEELLSRPGYRIAGHRGKTKVIAATATIASYEEHIAHLYGKSARRFPEVGPTPAETIYSREMRVDGQPVAQRVMASVWPTMTRLSGAVARVESAYLRGLAALARDPDAYRAILRRHTGAGELSDGDLRAVLDQASTLITYYMNKPRAYTGSDNLRKEIEETVESDPQHPLREIAAVADMITLTGDSELREIREAKSQLEDGGFGHGRWLAHVAATSIISHGVDVGRLNGMIFCGMPADTAEYIQSSSRVGRRLLGLSVVVHDTNRPREEGHYINHLDYHRNLDLHIQGVAINRGSRLLLGRTFPGLFAGLLRLYWNATHPKNQQFDFSMRDARPLVKALQDNRVKTDLREILRSSLGRSTAVTDPVFLEEQIEREWDAMEQEGLKRFGETDSLKGLFREHRPLLNHREIEASFPLLVDSESQEFVDRRSSPFRTAAFADEAPPGELADDAKEEPPELA